MPLLMPRFRHNHLYMMAGLNKIVLEEISSNLVTKGSTENLETLNYFQRKRCDHSFIHFRHNALASQTLTACFLAAEFCHAVTSVDLCNFCLSNSTVFYKTFQMPTTSCLLLYSHLKILVCAKTKTLFYRQLHQYSDR